MSPTSWHHASSRYLIEMLRRVETRHPLARVEHAELIHASMADFAIMCHSGGAAVFTAENDAAALAVVQADPAVAMQVFAYELRRWRRVDWAKRAAAAPPE